MAPLERALSVVAAIERVANLTGLEAPQFDGCHDYATSSAHKMPNTLYTYSNFT